MNTLKSSFNAQQAQSIVDAIKNAINQSQMSARTMLPAEIIETPNKNSNNVYWYQVQPLLKRETVSGDSVLASTIINVPAMNIRCGNTGLLLKYQKGDKVIIGVSDRDWSLIKNNWQTGNAQGYIFHCLEGSFIIGYLEKDMPTNYIDMTDNDNMKIHNPNQLTIENKQTNIDSTTFQVSGNSSILSSNKVELGKEATLGVLLENVIGIVNGVVDPSGHVTGTATFTGLGSKTIKASI